MRFPASELLNGACCAALVVFAVGHAPTLHGGSAGSAAVLMQDAGAEQPDASSSGSLSERTSGASLSAAAIEPRATPIETASTTTGDADLKSDALPVSDRPSTTVAVPPPKSSGGLGAAADGGIDAYVPPIVRQRLKTVPLASSIDAKRPKGKPAAEKKAKPGSKQALGAVTPASVKR